MSYLRLLGSHSIVFLCASVFGVRPYRVGLSKGYFSDAFFGSKLLRLFAVLLEKFQTNVFHKRIGLANTYGGSITMTTLILLFGYSTPRLLRWIGKRLAYVAG